MSFLGSPLKYPIVLSWLILFIISALIFLGATIIEPKNLFANIASFFATMMGAGASGLVTFYLVDLQAKRRQDASVLWHYKSVLDFAFLLSFNVYFYSYKGFKILKLDDENSFEPFQLHLLVTAKSIERSLNHAIDISHLLNDLCTSLKYMNYRMTNREKLRQMGISTSDLGEGSLISELSRSTLNDLYPMIQEFATDVLNPALRDVEDMQIRDSIFALKENYNAFTLMHDHPQWKLGLDFNQNILNYFRDFIHLYELFIEKDPINLKVVESSSSKSKDGTEIKLNLRI